MKIHVFYPSRETEAKCAPPRRSWVIFDVSSARRSLAQLPGGLNRSTQHLEQLAINNDDGLPNRSPKCFQRVPPQPAIPITGFALPPSYHHEISDLSANNRSLPSKGKCCVDRLNPPISKADSPSPEENVPFGPILLQKRA